MKFKALLTILALATFSPVRAAVPVVLTGSPVDCASSLVGPGDYERSLVVNGLKRRYFLHVPPGYSKDRPLPSVWFLHGGGGTARAAVGWQGLDALADAKSFVTAYPDGTGPYPEKLHTWNAGACCGWAMNRKVNDVAFVTLALEDASRFVCLDRARVHAAGFSNGGMMAYRLACEAPNVFASVASVAGTPGVPVPCRIARAVSAVHFHGTADPYEPYMGGVGKSFPGTTAQTNFMSVPDTADAWARGVGAGNGPPTTSLVIGSARLSVWTAPDGNEFTLWTLDGGGHTWPGGTALTGWWALGPVNKDVKATPMIWDFFLRHPIK